ncbi:unnamed protein product [Polarella glacialis]|uniref:GST N-terminal domain-containing protein n=1 Tax=Polarella glacialis TaxID=89957 RepID=A0A813KAZ2_POLGL|nr:unnamed protein product [Polarella glacialis]
MLKGDGDASCVLQWLLAVNGVGAKRRSETTVKLERSLDSPLASGSIRLYSWQLSYFSGKVRGYLRYKARLCNIGFDEVVASPAVVAEVLLPSTGSSDVPQVQLPDGRMLQDSKELIDAVELLYTEAPVMPPLGCPRQRLACQLIELLGDEWLLVPAYHWRWAYSGDGSASQRMPAFMAGARPLLVCPNLVIQITDNNKQTKTKS